MQPGLYYIEQMLTLQRTIGNQAVNRLLTKERQNIPEGTPAARQTSPAVLPRLLNSAGPVLPLNAPPPQTVAEYVRGREDGQSSGNSARLRIRRAFENPGGSPAQAPMHERQSVALRLDMPGSPFEHSADAIADRALPGEAPARHAAPVAAARPAPAPGPAVAAALNGGAGALLPSAERAAFETRLGGADLSDVRIHDDEAAHAAAEEIGARAFTRGRDIFFGAGRWPPEDRDGRRLLAHELAHTVQQAPPELLLRDRNIVADFSQRPQYPVASTPARPPGTIVFKPDAGEASYIPYGIYRPEDIPSWLYELRMKSGQAVRIRNPGASFATINDILDQKIPFPDPDQISIGDMINYARTQGGGFDLRLLIGFVDGGFRFLGWDELSTSAGAVHTGFVEASKTTGAVGRVLFADRVIRALARGIGEMRLEVGLSKDTETFHIEIRRIAGISGELGEGGRYESDTRQMARVALAWSDVLSPAERQGLAGIAAQQEPPTPQAAQAVLAGRGTGEAELPVAGVPAAGPVPAAAVGETMEMMERFRAQLRGNIRRPTEVGTVRELIDPDVQAQVLSQSFGFALAEGRLYRLEQVGQGIRVSEVVPEPIVQPIAAPVGPVEPFEAPIMGPQIVNLDPSRAIRIGENAIPPSQTVAVLAPGEFIIGYSQNQLVAIDPLTGHPLLGVFEGGQWYEVLDPTSAPLDFDPETGARVVNLGNAEPPVPAVEIDTDMGPQQTTFQRAPISTVGVGVGGVIMVANELMKWVGATLDVQRAAIAAGTGEFVLWERLGAEPVPGMWDAHRMAPASPGADAQTGVVVASWRFPYIADIDAARLRSQLPSRIKTYAEYAVLIASLGRLDALTQKDGRWIVKVNRPQGATHKIYDITEAMNTVEGQTLASADTTLRDRLAARPQAARGRILHIRPGATLYRSESESRIDQNHQPLIDAGDRLGPNAWVREIRSGRGSKLFVEPVNADAYQAVALTKYMILRDIKDVWRECKEGGREVIPAELPSFSEGPLTSFQAGPETTGEQRFGWTRYIVRPQDPDLAVTPNSTIAFGELRAFWVSESDTTVVAEEAVANFLRQ